MWNTTETICKVSVKEKKRQGEDAAKASSFCMRASFLKENLEFQGLKYLAICVRMCSESEKDGNTQSKDTK